MSGRMRGETGDGAVALAEAFELHRPRLVAIAYGMLGVLADAEGNRSCICTNAERGW
jgi:DNA-directed RNA polymerase specialized sigma24 family protein